MQAFSGHVLYFEFMSEMHTPKDFPKALYISQSIGTAMYLLAGAGVYAIAGDAEWLQSPVNTTLKSGAAFVAVQIMIICHIACGTIISGLFVTRIIKTMLEKHILSCISNTVAPAYEAVPLTRQDEPSADASDDEATPPPADDDSAGEPQREPRPSRSRLLGSDVAKSRFVWFVSSVIGYGGAMLVASIIPYFSEILGVPRKVFVAW